jgi:hypothetical protein
MKTFVLFIVMTGVAWDSSAGAENLPGRHPAALSKAVPATGVTMAVRKSTSNAAVRLRYHRLHGRWWYLMPSGEWAQWDGTRWTTARQNEGTD